MEETLKIDSTTFRKSKGIALKLSIFVVKNIVQKMLNNQQIFQDYCHQSLVLACYCLFGGLQHTLMLRNTTLPVSKKKISFAINERSMICLFFNKDISFPSHQLLDHCFKHLSQTLVKILYTPYERYRPEVSEMQDSLLWEKGYQRSIAGLDHVALLVEMVESSHNVILDVIPCSLIKRRCVTIISETLVWCTRVDGCSYLFFKSSLQTALLCLSNAIKIFKASFTPPLLILCIPYLIKPCFDFFLIYTDLLINHQLVNSVVKTIVCK